MIIFAFHNLNLQKNEDTENSYKTDLVREQWFLSVTEFKQQLF